MPLRQDKPKQDKTKEDKPKQESSDFENQTDDHYRQIQLKKHQIRDTNAEIYLLQHEANIILKRLIRPAIIGFMEISLFINYQSKTFDSPNINFLTQKLVEFLPHFEAFAYQGRKSHSKARKQYLFKNISKRFKDNDKNDMICSIIDLIAKYQDGLIIIYGKRGSGKHYIRDQMLHQIFGMIKKILLEGMIDIFDIKLTCIIKDYDIKISEILLRKETYDEQITT